MNTLKELLPAIARLNPHVNIKAIVIGLMNRLSSYAQNESSTESREDKQRSEEEAVTALLEKIRISKETEAAKEKEAKTKAKQPNGEQTDTETSGTETSQVPTPSTEEENAPAVNGADTSEAETPHSMKRRGIPPNVKLFEIFYGQVTHLVQAQRLPIQDTIALLVSLAYLAL